MNDSRVGISATRVGEPITCPDGSSTYHSERFDQTYHSVYGALTESEHIFLGATGVQERLSAGKSTRVLEVGFGLGLNCLLSADQALMHGTPLYFHSLENALLDPALLAALNYRRLLKLPALSDRLLIALRERRDLPELQIQLAESVELRLSISDATTQELPMDTYHACYLDAFSPDVNPECWQPDFLQRLYGSLCNGGVLATYSARSSVRRALAQAGFAVQKRPGPRGKRDIVIAVKSAN